MGLAWLCYLSQRKNIPEMRCKLTFIAPILWLWNGSLSYYKLQNQKQLWLDKSDAYCTHINLSNDMFRCDEWRLNHRGWDASPTDVDHNCLCWWSSKNRSITQIMVSRVLRLVSYVLYSIGHLALFNFKCVLSATRQMIQLMLNLLLLLLITAACQISYLRCSDHRCIHKE